MAKWMDDEQKLSTRRGGAWCTRATAVPRPSLPASPVASRPVLPRGPSSRGNPWSPVSGSPVHPGPGSPVAPPFRDPPRPSLPGCPVASRPGLPRGPSSRATPWSPSRAPPCFRPGLPRRPRPGILRAAVPLSNFGPGPPSPPSPTPSRTPAPGSPVAPRPGLPRAPVVARAGGGRTGRWSNGRFHPRHVHPWALTVESAMPAAAV